MNKCNWICLVSKLESQKGGRWLDWGDSCRPGGIALRSKLGLKGWVGRGYKNKQGKALDSSLLILLQTLLFAETHMQYFT